MRHNHYTTTPATYYGLATSSYMDTKRARHLTEDEYDALSCLQQSGYEYEVDLDDDARIFLMTGKDNPAEGAYSFEHE